LFEAGDRVGIIGPSGSGKSTLLKLVSGLLEPSSGTVRINDADRRTCSPNFLARKIGYLPQHPNLLSGTVLSNVRFFRAFLEEETLHQAVKRAALGDEPPVDGRDFADEHVISPGSLSGGQQQRVGIARCLAGRPVVLVLDEPTSALDTQTRREVLEQIFSDVSNQIVLVSTHEHSVLQYCNRLLVLGSGRVVSDVRLDDQSDVDSLLESLNLNLKLLESMQRSDVDPGSKPYGSIDGRSNDFRGR